MCWNPSLSIRRAAVKSRPRASVARLFRAFGVPHPREEAGWGRSDRCLRQPKGDMLCYASGLAPIAETNK
jgi:hypothetical protein